MDNYISIDENGNVNPFNAEPVEETAEVRNFKRRGQLADSDAGVIRGIDEIIDILKAKNFIKDDDISDELKAKLASRKQLREDME